MEELLEFKLPKSRPHWNRNPKTNFCLELDGNNEEHNFAFEFQGRQHFFDNVFYNSSLEEIKYRDKIKKENCINNNVILLIVNNIDSIRTYKQITKYIISILIKNNIKYNNNYSEENIYLKIKSLYIIPNGFKNFGKAKK